jgi:hypothetical protein
VNGQGRVTRRRTTPEVGLQSMIDRNVIMPGFGIMPTRSANLETNGVLPGMVIGVANIVAVITGVAVTKGPITTVINAVGFIIELNLQIGLTGAMIRLKICFRR